jgi:hypothetical protein
MNYERSIILEVSAWTIKGLLIEFETKKVIKLTEKDLMKRLKKGVKIYKNFYTED